MRMTDPKVSVIIPTRDRATRVRKAIRSVLTQSFEDFELLVVDDGSTDTTRSTVTALDDPRVRYLHQPPSGAAAARNRGAAAARGEYLVFLDSDDEARRRWLEELVGATCTSAAPVAFCGIELRDENGGPGVRVPPIPLGPLFNDWRGNFLAGAFLLRRELFLELGGYRTELRANQHTELGFRLVDLCSERGWSCVHVDQALVVSHRHRGPRIRNDSRAVLEATEYMLDHYRERLQRHPGDYTDYLAVAGALATRLGEGRRARRHLVEAIRFDPRGLKNYFRLLRTFVPRTPPDRES
jgi:glycosyltransferase involved in cell wall biosynthesis